MAKAETDWCPQLEKTLMLPVLHKRALQNDINTSRHTESDWRVEQK